MITARHLKRFSRIRRSERGATAIEYGLIAGLIAIGIVGSLVGTKASLNSVFGMSASGLGSANGSSTQAPQSQAAATAAYWGGKTLVSTASVTGGKKFTYSDGTTAQYTSGNAAPFSNQLVINDPINKQMLYTWTDSAGNPNLYEVEYHYFPNGNSGPRSGYDCSAPCSNTVQSTFSGSPPLPTGQVQTTYNQSGQQLTNQTITPTSDFLNMAAAGYQNYLYFKSLSGQ